MATTMSTPGLRTRRGILLLMVLLATGVTIGALAIARPGADTSGVEPDAHPASLAPASPPAMAEPDLSAIPGGTSDWWAEVTQAIDLEEYKFTEAESGLQAPNRAHNFRSRYREAEVEIVPRLPAETAAWRLSWHTNAWGRSGEMTEVGTASPAVNVEGTRVTYRHDGMSEWYENRREGLEQGFTVEKRPTGEGPLRIEGEFGGAARPVLRDGGAIDLLDENRVALVRYGELAVWDAAGKELPASLAVTGSRVAIVVDDRDAEYPLIVDPLMTTPAWTAEPNQAVAAFGWSVSTAGDVNGDGFSDVIVGAVGYDNGEADEGRAFVYHGSPSGLSTTSAWTAEPNQVNAAFGVSVSTAGDVNGDGHSDVIVGAVDYDNGQTNEGRVYAYHGTPTGLATSAAWTAESNQGSSWFGEAVSTAGDVNGDGFSDVVVGASEYTNGQFDEGRAYVYHGSAAGLGAIASWTAESDSSNARFASSVSTAGDVNGDGFSDVIIGASNFHIPFPLGQGRAYVYHGSAAGLSPSPHWVQSGSMAFMHLGSSVSTAGDVNGDGFSDVVVGAIGYGNGETREGRALVYNGSHTGLSSSPAWTAESDQVEAWFGSWVSTAGDVNGDGFSDVMVVAHLYDNGQSDEGRAYVYHGSIVGLSTTPTWTAESNQVNAQLTRASTAGDVNSDGFSDVIVGTSLYDNGHTDEGRAYVYHGAAAGLATTTAWTAESNQTSAFFGYSVSTAGDVNGDGFSDVMVGAYRYDNGQADEGRAFVYHGSLSGPATTASWTGEPNQASARYGESVSTAGDVNGDGYSDVIVGAPGFDNGQSGEGRAYVYHGSASGLAATAARTVESNLADAEFGISVSTAGDVNGDGFLDVIVGAWLFANGQLNEGRAFVYHGSPTGIPATASWTAESNQASAWFGYAVSTAGDVNGDGFSDVIIGAPLGEDVQTNEGLIYVYHGSASGLGTTFWHDELNQASAQLGWSVSTAGDVNGDGYSDIIAGAAGYSNGQAGEGGAFVYQGAAGGLPFAPDWTAESNQASAFFGWAVSTAGDVNGDGFSEVVVSARRYDNGQVDEGRTFAYHGSDAGLATVPNWTAESNQTGAELGYSVSTAGDVNGDGYSDVIVGAHLYDNGAADEGRAFIYYGNEASRLIRPRSVRVVEETPIAPFGRSDSPFAFRIEGLGSSPAGRARVWLEYEVKAFGVPFDGAGVERGPIMNTGLPQNLGSVVLLRETADGLVPQTLYHWRMRVASDSPFFPRSRWVSPIGNAPSEADLRTAQGSAGLAARFAAPGPHLLLGAGTPNPFVARTDLGYTVPEAGRLRLKVYSVTGREVASLVDQVQEAGRYSVRWDGRDREGQLLPAGVYFARLQFGDRIESQKLVLAR